MQVNRLVFLGILAESSGSDDESFNAYFMSSSDIECSRCVRRIKAISELPRIEAYRKCDQSTGQSKESNVLTDAMFEHLTATSSGVQASDIISKYSLQFKSNFFNREGAFSDKYETTVFILL